MTVWLFTATKREFDDTVAIHPTSAEGMSFCACCFDYQSSQLCFRIGHIKVDEEPGNASENVH
jgi:hypothetical protein